MLTANEINFLLELIAERFGRGYSDNKQVCGLQAKLSVMGQVSHERGSIGERIELPHAEGKSQ